MKSYLLLLIFALSSCTNMAYRKVATDVDRSPKNKTILRNVCEVTFPAAPPIYIKGDTRIDSFIDTIIKSKVDTVGSYIYDTVVIHKIVKQTTHDTIVQTNRYRDSEMDDKMTIMVQEDLKNKQVINELSFEKKTWRRRAIILSFGYLLLALLVFIRMYLKYKPL